MLDFFTKIIGQYNMFLVLNESGLVLAWQLTRGTSFKQVYTLLKLKKSILLTVACCGKSCSFYIWYKHSH